MTITTRQEMVMAALGAARTSWRTAMNWLEFDYYADARVSGERALHILQSVKIDLSAWKRYAPPGKKAMGYSILRDLTEDACNGIRYRLVQWRQLEAKATQCSKKC